MSGVQYEFDLTETSEDVTQAVLIRLLRGPASTRELAAIHHRFSINLGKLRERGYRIDKKRYLKSCEFRIIGKVAMIGVTDEMKAAYYETEHWRSIRAERLAYDQYRCCFCKADNCLQVHHWKYDLFCEQLRNLTTLCNECHEELHSYGCIKIRFPASVTPEIAAMLGAERSDSNT